MGGCGRTQREETGVEKRGEGGAKGGVGKASGVGVSRGEGGEEKGLG